MLNMWNIQCFQKIPSKVGIRITSKLHGTIIVHVLQIMMKLRDLETTRVKMHTCIAYTADDSL